MVSILFVLILASDRTVLNENDVFSILVVSVFQKICFKVKVLKTYEIFTDYHIKTCRSLKQRAILKIPGTAF